MSDVGYCYEGKHIVPKEQLTSIRTGQKGTKRQCCEACKNMIIDRRNEIQREREKL